MSDYLIINNYSDNVLDLKDKFKKILYELDLSGAIRLDFAYGKQITLQLIDFDYDKIDQLQETLIQNNFDFELLLQQPENTLSNEIVEKKNFDDGVIEYNDDLFNIDQPSISSEQFVNSTQNSGINIVFKNYQGKPETLLTQLKRAAQDLKFSDNIEILYHSNGEVSFYLQNIGIEQGNRLQKALQHENNNLNISCFSFRDYLINEIFAKSPEQKRFNLKNIPSSTPSAEIARAVMSQYHEQIWPEGIQAVVEASSDRLQPTSALHDNGINENSTPNDSPINNELAKTIGDIVYHLRMLVLNIFELILILLTPASNIIIHKKLSVFKSPDNDKGTLQLKQAIKGWRSFEPFESKHKMHESIFNTTNRNS